MKPFGRWLSKGAAKGLPRGFRWITPPLPYRVLTVKTPLEHGVTFPQAFLEGIRRVGGICVEAVTLHALPRRYRPRKCENYVYCLDAASVTNCGHGAPVGVTGRDIA